MPRTCTSCGRENRDGARFCQSCGAPFVGEIPTTRPQAAQKVRSREVPLAGPAVPCARCKTPNVAGMKFCKNCGQALAVPLPVAAVAPMGPTAPRTAVCASCGTPSTGSAFCQQCGAPISGPVAAAPVPAAPPPVAAAAAPPPVAPVAAAPVAAAAPWASPTPPAGPAPTPAPASSGRPKSVVPAPMRSARPSHDTQRADMSPTIISSNEDLVGRVPADPPVLDPQRRAPTAESAFSARPIGVVTVGPGRPAAVAPQARAQVLARLVSVRRDGSDGDVHEITEEAVDVGRTAGQLTFADDPYLSDRHCRLCISEGQWVVQDLESCNGVYLRLHDAASLRDGDRLLLGKQVLAFEVPGDPERNLAPAVQHGVMVFGSPLRAPWGRLRQLTVAGVYRDVYHLYRARVVIGREDGDLMFPDDEFMSRQHVALTLAGGKVQVQDLGSSNGTFLRIRDRPVLKAKDMLRVGDQLLRFELG